MIFTDDARMSLGFGAALVNLPDDDRALTSAEGLDHFLDIWGDWTGSRTRDERELVEVAALRPRLRGLWEPDEVGRVELVNSLLRDAGALPQLVRHGSWSWHIHAVPEEASLAERIVVEVAMAMVDVIRAEETERLRICAAEDCEDVLVDLSKNRSRRYCESGCGNRVAAAAYRARRSHS